MPTTSRLTRRRFLATTAASTAVGAMPHVRGAHAAGKLTIGLWDHWVPGANTTSTRLIEEWAAKEKVEVQIDYITTQVTLTPDGSDDRSARSSATSVASVPASCSSCTVSGVM